MCRQSEWVVFNTPPDTTRVIVDVECYKGSIQRLYIPGGEEGAGVKCPLCFMDIVTQTRSSCSWCSKNDYRWRRWRWYQQNACWILINLWVFINLIQMSAGSLIGKSLLILNSTPTSLKLTTTFRRWFWPSRVVVTAEEERSSVHRCLRARFPNHHRLQWVNNTKYKWCRSHGLRHLALEFLSQFWCISFFTLTLLFSSFPFLVYFYSIIFSLFFSLVHHFLYYQSINQSIKHNHHHKRIGLTWCKTKLATGPRNI